MYSLKYFIVVNNIADSNFFVDVFSAVLADMVDVPVLIADVLQLPAPVFACASVQPSGEPV